MSLSVSNDLCDLYICVINAAPSSECAGCLIALFNLRHLAYPAVDVYVKENLPDFSELQAILSDYGDTLFVVAIIHIVMTIIAVTGACIFNYYMVQTSNEARDSLVKIAMFPIWSIVNCFLVVTNQAGLVREVFGWIVDEIEGNGAEKEEVEGSCWYGFEFY
eukprot:scaffold6760_cov71-Cylindrotheca_fusiformis.AAC.2